METQPRTWLGYEPHSGVREVADVQRRTYKFNNAHAYS